MEKLRPPIRTLGVLELGRQEGVINKLSLCVAKDSRVVVMRSWVRFPVSAVSFGMPVCVLDVLACLYAVCALSYRSWVRLLVSAVSLRYACGVLGLPVVCALSYRSWVRLLVSAVSLQYA